ncbi:MAG: hypothetical protein JAY85_14925 [Candidatus Thiodiazotropha weberae]|uniref:Uncharacterized protein n=1 Tax=Candidatus Thiodiazotropha endoloripes TaxID=1818881 RepID=A0A1E2USQ9_9GAMM|nr:hypothetical protein [Candidatus Thiodiazotropha endoloripes]MCG7899733.1 hypothetical protein [Candidatus Thiodiazotropha weberae]ODB97793.1 hypothetical protein A3196_14125 [Candidatus Thiodiazotropha endoloripes]
MSRLETIRDYRRTIYSIAEFMIRNKHAVSEFGNALVWSDLEHIPTWLLWDEGERYKVIMTAGTIFLLPSIRIWIDAKKIQEVRSLIGDELFDLILKTTKIDNYQIKYITLNNIQDSLSAAGSAVIISSSSMRVRPWISRAVPKPKGKLDSELAKEIMKHTIFIINQNRFKS